MVEYYKLSLRVKNSLLGKGHNDAWESIYFNIDEMGNPKVIATHPSVLTHMLGINLEKLTAEDKKQFLESMKRDLDITL